MQILRQLEWIKAIWPARTEWKDVWEMFNP